MEIKDFPFWCCIEKQARLWGFDPMLIAAIIVTESNGETNAIRYEDHWKWFVKSVRFFGMSSKTEEIGEKISWGLMQIMGSVAQEFGFNDYFPVLCDPEMGIYYGCKYLAHLKRTYPNSYDFISAYNQGKPRKKANGNYRNQHYVDKVLNNLKRVKASEYGKHHQTENRTNQKGCM